MRKTIALSVTICLALFAADQLQAQNLRALWHLDEGTGTTVSDSSGNGNTGCFPSIVNVSTCFGTLPAGVDDPTWTTAADAKFGNSALSFDADGDDLVFVPSSASLSPTAAITLEAWVNVGMSTEPFMSIVRKIGPGPFPSPLRSYALYLFLSGGAYGPSFEIDDPVAGPKTVGGGSIVPGDGKWHHLAGTYDGAALRMWVDGFLVGTNPFVGSINSNSTPVNVGRHFTGKIDEVRVWGRALSLREIRTSDQSGLHGLWHFDTLTGGLTTPDASGYNNTGTFSSVAADTPLVTSPFTPASFGHALVFDGDDAVTVPNAPELDLGAGAAGGGSLGISLYVATDGSFSATTAQKILGKVATCTGTPEYEISQDAAGKLVFTSGGSSLTGSAGLTKSGKFHVAAVVNGAKVTLYLNGAVIASHTPFTFGANNTAALQIGNSGGCTTSTTPQGLNHATIDEVSLYGTALSDSQVAFLSGTTTAGTASEAGDLSRAPLKLPGTIGQELGSGVVGTTDWSFDGTSPGMALGFWVPIDGEPALTSITLKEHGFESTPHGSCGDVFGTVLAFGGMRAFITAARNDTASGCIGDPANTVHLEGNISSGGDIGLTIHWP